MQHAINIFSVTSLYFDFISQTMHTSMFYMLRILSIIQSGIIQVGDSLTMVLVKPLNKQYNPQYYIY